jgi:hypothetical protein
MAHYHLFVPAQAVGTSVVFFDLFNASGSNSILEIKSVIPVVSGAVAISGVIAVDLFLTKTSAVGTGGTLATEEGTSLTACTITQLDNTQKLQPGITARLTPSGGATAAGIISTRSVFTEETNAGSYAQIWDMVRGNYVDVPPLTLGTGQGIRVVQNAVASLGNVAFDVIFNVITK